MPHASIRQQSSCEAERPEPPYLQESASPDDSRLPPKPVAPVSDRQQSLFLSSCSVPPSRLFPPSPHFHLEPILHLPQRRLVAPQSEYNCPPAKPRHHEFFERSPLCCHEFVDFCPHMQHLAQLAERPFLPYRQHPYPSDHTRISPHHPGWQHGSAYRSHHLALSRRTKPFPLRRVLTLAADRPPTGQQYAPLQPGYANWGGVVKYVGEPTIATLGIGGSPISTAYALGQPSL